MGNATESKTKPVSQSRINKKILIIDDNWTDLKLMQRALKKMGYNEIYLADKGIDYLQAPVKRVCGYDTPFPYFKLERDYIPSTQRIVDTMNEVIGFS